MEHQKILKNISEYFGIEFRGSFKYLECTHREVTLRNFLGGCPVAHYKDYGSLELDREKHIEEFLNSPTFTKEFTGTTATVISRRGFEDEVSRVARIDNPDLKKELTNLYNHIIKKMGDADHLTLIASDNHGAFNDVLLHEFVHEVVNGNGLRIEAWEWNEGLVSYMTNWGLGKAELYDGDTSEIHDPPMYIEYAKKWKEIFKDTKTPEERRKIIEEKVETSSIS